MGALIPEYRTTLGRMRTQVDNLRQRLEDACEEIHALQEQVLCSNHVEEPACLFPKLLMIGTFVSMDSIFNYRSDETSCIHGWVSQHAFMV